MKTKKNNKKFSIDDSVRLISLIIITMLSIVLSRKYLQGVIEKYRENQADNNVEKSKNGKNINIIAQAYKNAVNPSGTSWLQWSDGTDEDAIFNLANDTKGSLNEINKAYKNKFQISLVDDLRTELSSNEFNKWYTTVTSK
jgi:hypothetical protein